MSLPDSNNTRLIKFPTEEEIQKILILECIERFRLGDVKVVRSLTMERKGFIDGVQWFSQWLSTRLEPEASQPDMLPKSVEHTMLYAAVENCHPKGRKFLEIMNEALSENDTLKSELAALRKESQTTIDNQLTMIRTLKHEVDINKAGFMQISNDHWKLTKECYATTQERDTLNAELDALQQQNQTYREAIEPLLNVAEDMANQLFYNAGGMWSKHHVPRFAVDEIAKAKAVLSSGEKKPETP